MQPSYKIGETANQVYQFAKANFIAPFLSVLPYALLTEIVSGILPKKHVLQLPLGLLSAYFLALFAANLHRAYLLGRPAETFNPLKPTRNDWRFIGVLLLMTAIIYSINFGLALGLSLIPQGHVDKLTGMIFGLVIILAVIIGINLIIRFYFALPDRAIGGNLKLMDAFRMSRGLVWKVILVPCKVLWLPVLIFSVVFFTAGYFGLKTLFAHMSMGWSLHIIVAVIAAPFSIGICYWCEIVIVATLSNYYLWARQKLGAGQNPAE